MSANLIDHSDTYAASSHDEASTGSSIVTKIALGAAGLAVIGSAGYGGYLVGGSQDALNSKAMKDTQAMRTAWNSYAKRLELSEAIHTDPKAFQNFRMALVQELTVTALPDKETDLAALLTETASTLSAFAYRDSSSVTFTLGGHSETFEKEVEKRRQMAKEMAKEKSTPLLGALGDASTLKHADYTDCLPPMKNQGQCGSCWAFSAVGPVEGRYCLATNKVIELSEGQLVDCDEKSHACDGGLMSTAYDYLVQMKKGGLVNAVDYDYEEVQRTCRDKMANADNSVKVVKNIEIEPTEKALLEALKDGPVAVAVAANCPAFLRYTSGVLTEDCGSRLDHGVVLVGTGYDEESGLDYWLIRNSWGDAWGDKGYAKLARGRKGPGIYGIHLMNNAPEINATSGSSIKPIKVLSEEEVKNMSVTV